jgi:hypothetical protein
LAEDDLILVYYGEFDRAHLDECAECLGRYDQLARSLAPIGESEIPARSEEYGRWVWQRLQPKLRRNEGRRVGAVAAIAAMLLMAFAVGRYTAPERASEPAPVRVKQAALGDHLERSNNVLAEVVNARAEFDFSGERERAESLLMPNRLHRQSAQQAGDRRTAQVLEDLERVLLEIAHSPDRVSSEQLDEIREQIRQQGIVFRVKVIEEEVQEVLEQ